MRPVQPLIELAKLFGGDRRLVAELERATEPWQALIEGLEQRKRCIVIDWKTFPSEVLAALDQILPNDRHRWAWCDVDRYENTTRTDQFLAIAGRALAASDLGLMSIDDGSDSYPLAIVPFSQIGRARRLARQTKLGRIASFAPATRPEPPAPLPPRRPSPPTRRAKQFRVRGADLLLGKQSHARGMVFTKGRDRGLQLADLATWPPSIRALTTTFCQLAWGPNATYATHAQAVLELHAGKRTRRVELPANLTIADLQFLGDRMLVFPEAAKPMMRDGNHWSPLPGLPRATAGLAGLARTGDGRDVILWNERGYECERGTWVATFELGRCKPSAEVATVAVADGFAFVDGERLKHAVRGKKARGVLPKAMRVVWACEGPGGSVVCCLIRSTSKAPAAVIYVPDSGEYAAIPATAFSLRSTMSLDAITYSSWSASTTTTTPRRRWRRSTARRCSRCHAMAESLAHDRSGERVRHANQRGSCEIRGTCAAPACARRRIHMGATATKIKGKLKKLEGRVTGDKVRETQGKVQEAVGKVGAKIKSGVRKAKAKLATTKAKVSRKATAAKRMP